MLNFNKTKRFSSYLVATFIVLATLSVLVILVALYGYFGKRVETEFRKKILAQKGQIEIILTNRINDINDLLRHLATDNIVRVTIMLDDKSQLRDRVAEFCNPREGVHLFIRKQGENAVIPKTYPGISAQLIDFVQRSFPYGDVWEEGGQKKHLIWWLSAPIMHQTKMMGAVHALYDMTRDSRLVNSVFNSLNGDVLMVKGDELYSLTSAKTWQMTEAIRSNLAMGRELVPLEQDLILSKIYGFENLYFQSSLQPLVSEKRKVTQWIGILAVVILTTSVLVSIYLGRKMVEPLRRMTHKAIRISQGQKDLLFDVTHYNYWEFNQLSKAFNFMLANLKDAEEQSRYRELLENVDDAVYILDLDGHILDANEAAYSPLGYTAKQFFALNLSNIVPREIAQEMIDRLGGEAGPNTPRKTILETTHMKKNGELLPVEIRARAINYRGRNVILNAARDITSRVEAEKERRLLQNQLLHSQKMEAIGTLAGGIAHDFNNLMMGIQGYASLIRLQTNPDHPNSEYIEGIEVAVTHAAHLTRQLLGFARKGKYALKQTNLNEVVTNSTRMFIRTRKEIVTRQQLGDGLWSVLVDPVQIEQVLLNLYLNAWHAMPEGGELYIQTGNVHLSANYCKPFEVPAGNYVKVSVTDNGVGIDRENIERIFEPFFTTKEVGKGTGLGLASAYGIIKNHTGIIRVYSEKGHGTTFDIYLPASDAVASPDILKTTELLQGNETVLLVDDEEATIMVEESMLRELGYTVFTARSGREAVHLYGEYGESFGLVILDMIMPEMGGGETYEELKKINPHVPVLLVSGYGLNKQIEDLMARGIAAFIQKPFDVVALSQKIRKVLETPVEKTSALKAQGLKLKA